jgi:hypothetical protein
MPESSSSGLDVFEGGREPAEPDAGGGSERPLEDAVSPAPLQLGESGREGALAPTRISTRRLRSALWSTPEDSLLLRLHAHGLQAPRQFRPYFPGKTAKQISERWRTVLDPTVVRGPWSREEDQTIVDFVAREGRPSWARCAALLPGRIAIQCRERWVNRLDPDMRRGPWTAEEDAMVIDLHQHLGNRWAQIAKSLPGRPAQAIRQRWDMTLKARAEARKEPNSSGSDQP